MNYKEAIQKISFPALKVGRNIKKYRELKHLSQQEVADALGIHVTVVSRYERDLTLPSLERTAQLSLLLEVPIDYLVFDKPGEVILTAIKDKELFDQFVKVNKSPDVVKEKIKGYIDALSPGQG